MTALPRLALLVASLAGAVDPEADATIPATAYPIPPRAYFVALDGSDRGVGSEGSPWRTVAKAVATAQDGATVVLRAGSYRESVRLAGKRLTFQPFPHESAWFCGSLPVRGWVPDGKAWRKDGWAGPPLPDAPPEAIDPAYPMAADREMVFLDGKPLLQVAGRDRLTPGAFYFDRAGGRLYLGDDPMGREVEAAVLPFALDLVAADGSVVRGLGFRRYATGYGPVQKAALRVDSASVTVENNTFAWNATTGLALFAAGGVVRGNRAVDNGQLGMCGDRADGLRLEGNLFARNNRERFRTSWEAGGVKVSRSRDMLWRSNSCEGNLGTGFWCDASCYDVTLVQNTSLGNLGHGFMYEISAFAVIAANRAIGNREAGIRVGAGSENVLVCQNTLVDNGVAVQVVDDSRTSAADPNITWDTRDISVTNNLIFVGKGTPAEAIQVVDHSRCPRTAAAMKIDLDGNLYLSPYPAGAPVLVRWPRGPAPEPFGSLAAFRDATQQERHGLGREGVSLAWAFLDPGRGDYRIKPGGPAAGLGVPLPARVALALGLPGGTAIERGAPTPP